MTVMPDWLKLPETSTLAEAFAREGEQIRFVGGCVRDALLGRSVKDIDAATPLTPDKVTALLAKAGIQAIPTGIDHGTITAVINKRPFEITTLRKDVSTDGRHAVVAFTDDWKEDASRRDFTMNALYLSPKGELTDYFNGEADAKEGRIRFIGDAKARIAEDYLRILRFFRFYAHYGKTAPDAKAIAACAESAKQIETLSAERVQHELLKLLAAPKSYHAVSFMQEQLILPPVLGFDVTSRAVLRRLEEMVCAFSVDISVAAKLLSLLQVADRETSVAAVAARLKLPNAFSAHMRALSELRQQISVDLSFPEQKRLIRKFRAPLFMEGVLLVWAVGNDIINSGHPYHAMLTLAREWQVPVFMVSGKDLQALGIAEGREMGELLSRLENEWEASDYRLTKEELLGKVK